MAQITITLSPATQSALNNLGYALYVMRAFNTTNAAGRPLVWLTSTQFADNLVIGFDVEYWAYVSSSPLVPGDVVVMSSAAPVALGQTATVDIHGVVAVMQGGNTGGVTILNGGTRPYITGLAAAADDGHASPIFGEPLYGLAEDIVAPLDRFLLTFSTQGFTKGTAIAHAMSQSLFVDLAGVDQRTVSFDINMGWSADGPWAMQVAAGADLTPILVHEMLL